MPVVEATVRRNAVPFIHVRGTHYEVGFAVGITFKAIIQSYLSKHRPLNKIFIPLYQTPEGKKAYDWTLTTVKKNYPQYLDEIQGTADGADVPFYKLFLLHMDEILPASVQIKSPDNCSGCSTVCSNTPGQEVLGHNEDALSETVNHFYMVSAHVIAECPKGRWKVKEEKFTSLCYAGLLPGFTMSYNHHGLIYSINIIRAKSLQAGKTPRSILTRALLAAKNPCEVETILTDPGTGIADAIAVNLIFLNQEGSKVFYNAEVGPTECPNTDSAVNIIAACPCEHIYHCNKFMRLNTPEAPGMLIESSEHRQKAMDSLPEPKCAAEVRNILGDTSDKIYPVYQDEGLVKTIATGIFDLKKMTWSIYTDNPKCSEPVLEIPILF